jgi:hypothetical protein
MPALQEEAAKRQKILGQSHGVPLPALMQEGGLERGEAAAQAAKLVGVSARTVYQQTALRREAPHLAEQQ